MITKPDWQIVHDQLTEDGRRRVGPPPTAEELLAYSRGELPAEEEARMREKLVFYPELAGTLTVPFPMEGAEPGDPDYLSDSEFEEHFAAMRKKMGLKEKESEGGRVVQFWPVATALAAAVAIVFGVLLWQTRARLDEPHAGPTHLLYSDAHRGPSGAPTPIDVKGDAVLIVPEGAPREYRAFRLELIDVAAHRTLWSHSSPAPGPYEALAIHVPQSFLKPGDYRVVVFGFTGDREEQVATYSLRVRS